MVTGSGHPLFRKMESGPDLRISEDAFPVFRRVVEGFRRGAKWGRTGDATLRGTPDNGRIPVRIHRITPGRGNMRDGVTIPRAEAVVTNNSVPQIFLVNPSFDSGAEFPTGWEWVVHPRPAYVGIRLRRQTRRRPLGEDPPGCGESARRVPTDRPVQGRGAISAARAGNDCARGHG